VSAEDDISAKKISQLFLDATAKAMLEGDFETLSAAFQLPHFISTNDKQTVLETQADLYEIFHRVREDYLRKQVTDLVRHCDVAEFRGPDTIDATHTTHMMSGNRRVNEPFPCYSILERTDGVWRIASSQYAVDKTTTVGHALHVMADRARNKS
jgi:hypothetical protein